MKSKEPNYFVRTLIILLCIGIGVLITYNFFYTEPNGEINTGVITLISFLLVLVLSESFDNFSIAKLISLNRKIEEKEKQNNELERKNSELINQIISVTNNQSQSQSHTSVFGDYYADKKKGSQSKEIDENQVQELLDVINDTPLINEQVDAIKADLTKRGLTFDSSTDEILIKHLAATQIALNFETTYNLIFGSQLTLLKELNAIKPQGLSKQEVELYISRVFKQFPNSYNDWDFDKYLSFLYSSFLILKTDAETIHITVRGVEFLSWIVRVGKREDKSL